MTNNLKIAISSVNNIYTSEDLPRVGVYSEKATVLQYQNKMYITCLIKDA